jgi:hypothetical protein
MIVVVLHCFTINDWEERFVRQLKRIKSSGLYETAGEIYVYITDPDNLFKEKIINLVNIYPKIQLIYSNINYGEGYKALCKVDELGKQNDNYKIFYFHTKGVFNKYKNFNDKTIDDLKINGVNCWVEKLEYFLIDKWKECVDKLNEYDTVGVTCNGNWWWGNFWWVTSEHLKKNKPFEIFYQGSRWDSESWLHEGNEHKSNIKKFEMDHFEYDPHYSYFPKYFYDGTDLSNLELIIIKAHYGYFAQQRDEGRPFEVLEDKLVDVTDKVIENINKFDKKKISIRPFEDTCNFDPAIGLTKSLRIKFKTNIEPEKEYVIASFENNKLDFGYFSSKK